MHIGADSIVLSGGYEDDEDYDDLIIYTGHGGLNPLTGKQEADQKMERMNLALAKSKMFCRPVRVIRGYNHKSIYAPKHGYRYDGLFKVDDYWKETGRAGFLVWRYRLIAIVNEILSQDRKTTPTLPFATSTKTKTIITQVVKESQYTQRIKKMYDFTCQICGTRLETPIGPYAESTYIKPVGKPHDGPDREDNILCLCPNHRILFTFGAISISNDFTLLGCTGVLKVQKKHKINIDFLKYHREHYYIGK